MTTSGATKVPVHRNAILYPPTFTWPIASQGGPGCSRRTRSSSPMMPGCKSWPEAGWPRKATVMPISTTKEYIIRHHQSHAETINLMLKQSVSSSCDSECHQALGGEL